MVRVITQETFDLVVTENMEEFGMERTDAVKDAKEQFEQQGVSLVNIVVSEQGSQVGLDGFTCSINQPRLKFHFFFVFLEASWSGLLFERRKRKTKHAN